MKGIQDLGNGYGYIYVTDVNSKVLNSIKNTAEGSRQVKVLGLQAASVAKNRRPTGTITVSSISGVGTITAINIKGSNYINANIAYTGATTTSDLASNIADGINDFNAGTGIDFTAIAISNIVYLTGEDAIGSSFNGQAVSVVNTGNLTYTATKIGGGTDSTDVYDSVSGYRFYLDADYGATDCTGLGSAAQGDITNAEEITDYIVTRGLQNANDYQNATISSGVLSITRISSRTVVIVDTESSGATDDLTDIVPTGFVDYDQIVCVGNNSGRVTTFKTSGNITLQGGNEFSTGDKANTVTLYYLSGNFYEISRTTQMIGSVADYRTANFPFYTATANGSSSHTAADNTTVTLTPNSSKIYNTITGTATLSTGNYSVVFSTTGAVARDVFIVEYNANLTYSGFSAIIGGITLNTNEALVGKCYIIGIYDGSAWKTKILSDLHSGYQIETSNMKDGVISVAKLASTLQYEVITLPVSFESGEQSDNRVKIFYDGIVVEIKGCVTKALSGTDDGTVTSKNGSGTSMTSGTLTFSLSSAIESAQTATPSANNTFSAGDELYFTSAKATAGGKVLLSIKIKRT